MAKTKDGRLDRLARPSVDRWCLSTQRRDPRERSPANTTAQGTRDTAPGPRSGERGIRILRPAHRATRKFRPDPMRWARTNEREAMDESLNESLGNPIFRPACSSLSLSLSFSSGISRTPRNRSITGRTATACKAIPCADSILSVG